MLFMLLQTALMVTVVFNKLLHISLFNVRNSKNSRIDFKGILLDQKECAFYTFETSNLKENID